ncbi:MAG TPA: sugar-binding protein, partial [Armatimonadota bacterium]|nr:sugar-binding protein [Armatimonadota bacterium]
MLRRCCWLALLNLLAAPAFAQTLVCGRAQTPPVIDALSDDDCWRDAMIATDLSVLGSGGNERAFRQATTRAAWDDRALYLHVICFEPDPASITAEVTVRDGEVWMEDAVEIFLQPDTGTNDYLHLIVNARGTLYDERNTSPDYDSQATVAATIGEQAWQVELAIPWGEQGAAPRPGQQWGLNVCREHRPADPNEWSTWAPLQRASSKFAWPALFGRLQFAPAPEPGRASALSLPEGLATNPDFSDLADGRPNGWSLSGHSTFGEIAPMLRHYFIHNDGDYGIASQSLDIPVKASDVYTVFAVVRGSPDATAGVAVVQEMADGRPDDLYPFWNMAVAGEFRLYSGRIRVDEGAGRFQKLVMYRSNKTGWVEFAYVQVHPGVLGVSGLFDADGCTRPEERGIGEPWPTPALPAFKPLPGGPIRALVFIGEFQRDAVELAERLDLDYDLVYCPTFRGSNRVEQAVAFGAEGILGRLARGEYDLIVLAGKPSARDVVSGILEAVRAGAGLVAVEPLAGGGPAEPEQYQRLMDALPTDPAGPEVLAGLTATNLGAGRIARITWSEKVTGLIPFTPGRCEWWEYRWGALARAALWAAGRTPAARIESISCGDDLTITARAGASDQPRLRVQWDNPLGIIEQAPPQALTPREGAASLTVPVPERVRRTRGPVIARAILTGAAGALDLGACAVSDLHPRVELGEIIAPSEAEPGGSVTVTVPASAEAGAEATVRADLVDGFGRVVSRAQSARVTGEPLALTLTVREPLCVYHRIVVTALDGGEAVDRREALLFVPIASADDLDDFHLGSGYAAMHVRCPEYLYDQLTAFLRARGVEMTTVNEYMIERGMIAFGGQIAGPMRYDGDSNVRDPSFCDPEQVQALAQRTVENVAKVHQWGFFGFNMSDEVHLQQRGAVEVDASECCRAGFAEWARECYGTIEAANQEWGTDFADFGAITVPLIADLQGTQNPARWVDFRLFMDRIWAGAYDASQQAVRE